MVPVSQVGGAMVLIVTIGVLASLFAPIVVIYDDPIPFLAMSAFMTIAFILVYTLKIDENFSEDNQQKVHLESLVNHWEHDSSEINQTD